MLSMHENKTSKDGNGCRCTHQEVKNVPFFGNLRIQTKGMII